MADLELHSDAASGSAHVATHLWYFYGVPSVPMAMTGSIGTTARVTVLPLLTHLWAWWDRAAGGGPCPSLPHSSLPEAPHISQGLPTLVNSATCASSTPSLKETEYCDSLLLIWIHIHAKVSGAYKVLACLAT